MYLILAVRIPVPIAVIRNTESPHARRYTGPH
jgi:hypothetical protein